MSKIVVKNKDEENPVPVEIIAESIEKIAKAMQIINSTRLTRRAIITLIHENSKVPKRDIEIILNNLDRLEEVWLKRK